MKANKAPERIWIDPATDLPKLSGHIDKDSIEYTRTDAFIEKALEFLDGCIPDYIDLTHANVDTFMNVDNKRFIDEFRKYMKGEKV